MLDFVVDYFASGYSKNTNPIAERQKKEARAMLEVADVVICSSRVIQKSVERFHPNVLYIPDSLDSSHFGRVREERLRTGFQGEFTWSGQASKLRDLEPILPLFVRQGISLRVITNKVSKSAQYLASCGVSATVHPWEHSSFAKLLGRADIGISYRELTPYNRGHSSFKLLAPMSQGLPVLASPLGSYYELLENGGGKVLSSIDEWDFAIRNEDFLNDLVVEHSRLALDAARKYETSKIADLYLQAFGSS